MSAVRKTKEYQRLATKAWPRETPEGLVEKLFKNRARLTRVAGELLSDEEIDAAADVVARRSSGAT